MSAGTPLSPGERVLLRVSLTYGLKGTGLSACPCNSVELVFDHDHGANEGGGDVEKKLGSFGELWESRQVIVLVVGRRAR